MKKKNAKHLPSKRVNRGRKASQAVNLEYTGKVMMTRDGSVFVRIEGQTDDVFVKNSRTRNALDGDTVRVVVTSRGGDGRKREGKIIEVLERSGRQFVGILHTVGAQAWVLVQSRYMPYDIEVDAEEAAAMGAKRGMKVAAVADGWHRGEAGPYGHLVDVLGEPGANETEMHAILAEFGLPYRFPEEVDNAADAISEEIGPAELKGRKDFRDTLTFTIDPADAKDFDDALSFKTLPSGNYEVGVHIADVSWYVRPGTAVDREARERGTSVYLVDRTVPMLPEKLSNKLCSLRPGEDKLTFSVVFEIAPKGEIRKRWIGRTVICSDFRLDYEEAQKIIMEGDPEKPLDQALQTLWGLADIYRKAAAKAGAIDFDRPEMKVEVDSDGRPVNVYEKVSVESNWLIEQFMLLANRTVAEFVATGGKMNGVAARDAKPMVYRVHGEPNSEKLARLALFSRSFGYRFGEELEGRAAARNIQKLLASAEGKPELPAFQDIALRSMAKAFYSTDNIGHYGLAYKFYTHFTSPIRRYPDTMVHRLLEQYLAGGKGPDRHKLEEECVHASEREVLAADAERTSVKYKLVEYMMDKVGLEFDGHISGMTEWGMYVEIEPTKIEGMVALREIRSDFYDFDEDRYRLIGRRSRHILRLGDPVRIRVKSANLEQRLLDFELIETHDSAGNRR